MLLLELFKLSLPLLYFEAQLVGFLALVIFVLFVGKADLLLVCLELSN
jgi:hypothetical protein